jgi:hypothetical protein
MRRTVFTLFLAAFALAPAGPALAQAPGVPIEEQQPLSRNEQILASAARLRESGALLTTEQVAAQLAAPTGGQIALLEPLDRPLTGRDLARKARDGYVRVGWYYRCTKCEKWHLDFGGGYAVAPDVLVTCHHLLIPKADMREAFLVAMNRQNEILPITAIVARSEQMDCVILQVQGGNLSPLALREDVAPGDRVFCFSEPLGQPGYFSNGIVNRFFWKPGRGGKEGSLDELEYLRVNVSTDWAPGSSGAAVLDEYGNAIGHVSLVAPMSPSGRLAKAMTPQAMKDALAVGDEKPKESKKATRSPDEAVVITLHEAVAARAVRALAAQAGEGIVPKTAAPAATEANAR